MSECKLREGSYHLLYRDSSASLQNDTAKHNYVDVRDCVVIAPNLHRRYSGITSVIITIVPELAKHIAIASLGPHLPPRVPHIKWWQIFMQGWSKPPRLIFTEKPAEIIEVSSPVCYAGEILQDHDIRSPLAGEQAQAKLKPWGNTPDANPLPTQIGQTDLRTKNTHITPADVDGEREINKRIWHARRNDEMIIGIILRDILRQPWLLTFTSTAQRHHTRFTQWLMRRMDALLAGSAKAAGFLETPAMVIDNSIDTSRFAPAPDREAAWQASGLPGKYGIGVFGRVRHQKGTDLFVEAMIRLLPRYPDFTAVIVGLCAPEQESFADKLKLRIAEAGLQNRIIFLGEVAQENIPFWFSRLTIYVAPMRWEGFGLTPIEAMASEVAVVATTAGAHEQIVVEGETGFLVPPDNLNALVNAIEPLLQNPQKAHEMGKKGRQKALAQHDVAIEAARILEAYKLLWTGQTLPDDRSQ